MNRSLYESRKLLESSLDECKTSLEGKQVTIETRPKVSELPALIDSIEAGGNTKNTTWNYLESFTVGTKESGGSTDYIAQGESNPCIIPNYENSYKYCVVTTKIGCYLAAGGIKEVKHQGTTLPISSYDDTYSLEAGETYSINIGTSTSVMAFGARGSYTFPDDPDVIYFYYHYTG